MESLKYSFAEKYHWFGNRVINSWGNGINWENTVTPNYGCGKGCVNYGGGINYGPFDSTYGYGTAVGSGGRWGIDFAYPNNWKQFGIKSIMINKKWREIIVIHPGVQIAIMSKHRNCIKGWMINDDLTLTKGWIVYIGGWSGWGTTFKEGYKEAKIRMWINTPIEGKLEGFKQNFPTLNTKMSNHDLFEWYKGITENYWMTKEEFHKEFRKKFLWNINSDANVNAFFCLTKNEYDKKIMQQLKELY